MGFTRLFFRRSLFLIDGAINFCKPSGITSAKALYRLRKLLNIRKSGHAGTLDPLATGVLVICTGRGTRLVEQWMVQPKVYRATARLDVTSTSFDADHPMHPVPVAWIPEEEQVRAVLSAFIGRIQQVPPAVSALKVGGRRAYHLTRKGKPPFLAPRPVDIYAIQLHRFQWPELEFDMTCGRGTYVRALIRDIGVALSTGGCLTALQRRAVGPFRIETACSLADIEADPRLEAWLVPLDEIRTQLQRSEGHDLWNQDNSQNPANEIQRNSNP